MQFDPQIYFIIFFRFIYERILVVNLIGTQSKLGTNN
jgi:hypothetical protein